MKKDKKNLGFTMIEMLATILVLLIVLLIATPSIRRMLNKTNDLSKEYVENLVIDAAKEYASVTNKTVTDTLKLVGDKNVIFLETLLNMGLIEQTDIDKLGTEARVLLTLKDNNYLEYKIVYDGSLAENTNGQIILLGGNPTYVRQNTPYMEPGYIALDSLGNIVNGEVEITGEVNTAILGVYEKTYKYTDEKNNVIEVKRTVIVYDSTYPKVTVATSISNNPYNNKYAKNGERITLNITFSKVVTDPKVTIGGREAIVTGSGLTRVATLNIPSNENSLINRELAIKVSDYKDIYENVGDTVTNVTSGNLVVFDNIAPVIAEKYAGSMLYADSTFAFGTNGFGVYNNSGNGTVTHARVALDNPYGSYVMRIKTAGTASPGLGGYVQSVNSRANAIYIHKIIAKIPVGFTIQRASNSTGTGTNVYWITPQEGTGGWKEYIYVHKAGSSGSFSNLGHVYLLGSGTSVTWDVAYSTIIDTGAQGLTGSITFRTTDNMSGYTHYGINNSSTVEPSYTSVSSSLNLGIEKDGHNSNGTHYIWVKDAAGNVSNQDIAMSSVKFPQYRTKICSEYKSCPNSSCSCTAYRHDGTYRGENYNCVENVNGSAYPSGIPSEFGASGHPWPFWDRCYTGYPSLTFPATYNTVTICALKRQCSCSGPSSAGGTTYWSADTETSYNFPDCGRYFYRKKSMPHASAWNACYDFCWSFKPGHATNVTGYSVGSHNSYTQYNYTKVCTAYASCPGASCGCNVYSNEWRPWSFTSCTPSSTCEVRNS